MIDVEVGKTKFYTHVEKLFVNYATLELNDELIGSLAGEVYASVKLDGSNGSVRLRKDGSIIFSSRNRLLTLENDNQGFANTFSDDIRFAKYLKKHPSHILFGEWMYTRGVLKYSDEIVGKFMVFDVYDMDKQIYLSPNEYVDELNKFEIDRVPELAVLKDQMPEDLVKLITEHESEWTSSGDFEGVVVKNYDYRDKYGRQVFGKIIKDEFKEIQVNKRSRQTIDDLEQEIVDQFVTAAFIKKEQGKIIERDGEYTNRNNAEMLGRVWSELIKEETWHMIRRYNLPKIDFARLHNLTVDKTKKVLKEWF